jgi:hypothetical protein
MVVVLRWVDDELNIHENFIGLYILPDITASTIVSAIQDTLVRLNLTINKVRGQCYDGASTMRGLKNGVAKQIQDLESRAIYTHCYGHSLNLAASDTVQKCKTMKAALETTYEITKLIKYSPRRGQLFGELKDDIAPGTPGVRVLCPTRWTVRADSMMSIIQNYAVLNELWEKACSIVGDTETIARIRGVAAQMVSFDFFFGLVLGEMLLRHTDNLSRTLQHSYISAAEGQVAATMTASTLSSIRNDEHYELFWGKVTRMAEEVDVDEPKLPRQRKRPPRYEDGKAAPEFHSTPKDYYRSIYYEALDLITQTIKDRFDQPGYRVYQCLENLLLKAAKQEDFSEELKLAVTTYGSDIHESNLTMQLKTLGANFKEKSANILTIREFLQKLTPTERVLLSEITTVMKLVLVMPATNAASERSFSAMRRIKTYLRSTMSQERLNNLMILHVHKDFTDALDLVEVANEFVRGNESRLSSFGKF